MPEGSISRFHSYHQQPHRGIAKNQARIEELEAIRRRVAEEERRHLQGAGFSHGDRRKLGCQMRKVDRNR